MAEPEMNVQQLYERLYGDMESKSKSWSNRLRRVAEPVLKSGPGFAAL